MNENGLTTVAGPLVSVIIGFKDWGLERLELSVRSIHDSLADIHHEVIISDYGSEDSASISALARRADARHEIVQTSGEWSRSRALNAGVRASDGEIIMATDADMLFTPRSLGRVVEQIEKHPQQVIILQCRDLPTGYTHEVVRREGFDWDRFAAIGQIRPRWGMGGLVAVKRENWERLRGWDERMHTYGGEDVDFGKRAQASGARIDWLDEPDVAMYHIWHPSSGASAARSAAATAAIAENRRIHTTDATFARNRVAPRYLPTDMLPLVTVLFDATLNGAAPLDATLTSVLGQTVQDIEVLVVGAVDDLPRDSRVIALDREHPIVRGTYATSVRAGEIWADDRLEKLLELWTPGTGLMSDHTVQILRDDNGAALTPLAVVQTTAPDPRATLLRSSLMPGDLTSTIDSWNDAVRHVAAAGAKWVIAPTAGHVTVVNLENEEQIANERAASTSAMKAALYRCGLAGPEPAPATITPLGTLANALLYNHDLTLEIEAPAAIEITEEPSLFDAERGWHRRTLRTPEGAVLQCELRWTGNDLAYVTQVARKLQRTGLQVRRRSPRATDYLPSAEFNPASLALTAEATYGNPELKSIWLAVAETDGPEQSLRESLFTASSVTVVLDRIAESGGSERRWLLARSSSAALGDALELAAALPTESNVHIVELPARQTHDEVMK